MSTDKDDGKVPITTGHRNLLLATSLLTLVLVILGGIVCVTDSSKACPDWPGCYGQLIPPLRINAILEYSHRVTAALTSLLIIASAIIGWRNSRPVRWVSWPPLIAIAFLLAVIVFGALVVLRGLEPGLAALDLGAALMVLALMVTATVVAAARHQRPDLAARLSFHEPLVRLALGTLILVFLVLVSGVLVAASGSPVRCLGWPLYGGDWPVAEGRHWLQLARRVLGGIAGVSIITVVVQAWRRHQLGAIRPAAAVVGLLFLAEIVIGGLMVAYNPGLALQLVHAALAAALWASLVALAVLAGWASSASE
ncbi:MAG: COX15/CtaA family protein [Anaerolineae bacterium]|nr:COX15/CtaA family protein [Anaerolineae bacterium]